MKFALVLAIASAAAMAFTGCGRTSSADVSTRAAMSASFDGAKYMLAEEPEGAVGIIAAREQGAHGEPIVIVGRVGGRANPWIEGRAAFMLLDPSITVVSEGEQTGEGVICTGDCCAAVWANSTAMVKFVDESGRPLRIDARELLGIKESDLVVVRGKTQKDEHGNFAVIADGIYVRR